MDNKRFSDALEAVVGKQRERCGIGTLSEKTLHAVLKRYFEPGEDGREIKIGRYVADIVGENGIIEIQTQGFDKLRDKLAAFLSCTRVTVVYPIPRAKYLCWIDPETGEVTGKRKSPRTGTVCDAFPELYKIKPLLKHPNLRLCLVLLELTEYRYLNGWSKDKKKGSSRYERIPDALVDEIYLDNADNYQKLLPQNLPSPFTARDYAKAAKISLRTAQTALNVLFFVGAVERTGKRGNTILYETAKPLSDEIFEEKERLTP